MHAFHFHCSCSNQNAISNPNQQRVKFSGNWELSFKTFRIEEDNNSKQGDDDNEEDLTIDARSASVVSKDKEDPDRPSSSGKLFFFQSCENRYEVFFYPRKTQELMTKKKIC